ncbi:hypothetical protein [Paenibacillus radicis (ex Gao et al. 2016)]|uniref:Uncharacterized protein n=1 Tax=Paenibacillus radicis (ex Gao et al. 2016) TaxID=1737354 RepID=A0A917H8B0_9BACL|nr:hypothetical protein [Paenibacillus radicis (ex Gao et al. 2016)]GGG70471.1 hypothetical protein GCM10010918_27270 [Paenibacillus radicis (ex Gao et al. 2016)]
MMMQPQFITDRMIKGTVMKRAFISVLLVVALLVSFAPSVFAAFSYTSPVYNLSGGTIYFGNGVIVNTGQYHDTLTVNVYKKECTTSSASSCTNVWVGSKTISLASQQYTYPGASGAPLIPIVTGTTAGQYFYTLSASGSWHVMAGIYN